MKRIEKLAVLLLLTLGFCGCTRTSEVKTDEKLAVQEKVKARSTEQSAETVQTGPETITTTVEEYEEPGTDTQSADAHRARDSASAPLPVRTPTGSGRPPQPQAQSGSAWAPSVSPFLVKRTVTVDQRGPVLDTKTASTQTAVDTSLAEKQEKELDKKKSTKWGFPWWAWALGACGVALGIGILRKTLLGKAVAAAEAAAKEVL